MLPVEVSMFRASLGRRGGAGLCRGGGAARGELEGDLSLLALSLLSGARVLRPLNALISGL